MLSPYRVLDLTDDRGWFAGYLLAQMGAEVVAVEPAGGHRARQLGPFAGDEPGLENALAHRAYQRGKASAVVVSQAELEQLAANADVVVDCGAFPPGLVDLDHLRKLDPRLVTVSISPFGLDGPKAAWRGTDLVVAAASGTMSITGDRDRPPVRTSLPQTWLYAGADAAVAALIALHERERSGHGQHADVSAQQSFCTATQFQMMNGLVGGDDPLRLPGGVELGPFTVQFVHACKDGHVTVTFLFGPMIGKYTQRLFHWMYDEGFCDESLRDKNWVDFAMDVFTGKEPVSELHRGTEAIARFMASHTKAELLDAAMLRNLLIAPVTTTRDVLDLPQLTERGYWDVDGGARRPGPFARFSASPLQRLGPPSPLGADTARLLAEPRRSVVPAPPEPAPTGVKPLEGVKILDFLWALAGPQATRILADFGATVIRVESEQRADVLRGVNPFRGEAGDQEGALQFHSLNAGKYGLALNLNTAEGREVARDLVRWADVVTESFAPGTMAGWGLSYEELREVKPDLIMLSSCLMGQTGPLAQYAGFGTMAAAMAGFYPITGWPDRMPAGPFTAFTDYISPRFTASALLGALEWKRRTGEGQYIDLSQMEASLQLLAPALLDDEINGRVAGRNGNADPHRAPHGAYPAAGDDRWVAIAVETDEQWAALAGLIGHPGLAGLGVEERLARQAELDGMLSAWTSPRDAAAIAEELQAAGVPAHEVQNSSQCVADPQFVSRRQFRSVPHAKYGESFVEGSPFWLSRCDDQPRWAGPTYGQHVEEVLGGFLGYDGDRIAELIIAGALE
jgi:crotonobetainyl-CoA:carnitine CoA-transferase CaiB-like acyl-CoA transferase